MSESKNKLTKYEWPKILTYAVEYINSNPETNKEKKDVYVLAEELIKSGYFNDMIIIKRSLPGGRSEMIKLSDMKI